MSRSARVLTTYTAVLMVLAFLLYLEGRDIGDGSATRDSAKATYYVGAAVVAALGALPWALRDRGGPR